MKHIILFLYIFTIPLLVACLSILFMNSRGSAQKTDAFKGMKPFVFSLLFATVSNLLAYYSEDFMRVYLADSAWLVCDLLYASIAFFWLQVKMNRVETKAGQRLHQIGLYFMTAYVASLIVLYTSNATSFGILDYLDYGLILLILANLLLHLRAETHLHPNAVRLYSALVSVLIAVTYLIFDLKLDIKYELPYIYILTLFLIGFFTVLLLVWGIHAEKKETNEAEEWLAAKPDLEEVFMSLKCENGLTNREMEILKEIYFGRNNSQIAEHFCISENTAKTHVHNLLKKLNAGSKLEILLMIQERLREPVSCEPQSSDIL